MRKHRVFISCDDGDEVWGRKLSKALASYPDKGQSLLKYSKPE